MNQTNQTWKRCEQFTKYEIADIPYLLPFGQMIADHKRGLRINASGAYIWELLQTEITFDRLLQRCAAHWQTDSRDLPALEQDVSEFLSALLARGLVETAPFSLPQTMSADSNFTTEEQVQTGGIISESGHKKREKNETRTISGPQVPEPAVCDGETLDLEIGGLSLRLCGPRELFSDAFTPFLSPAGQNPHQTLLLSHDPTPSCDPRTILLQNKELTIYRLPGTTQAHPEPYYLLFFPSMKQLTALRLSADGSRAIFFSTPPRNKAKTDTLRNELFHAIRLSYLYLAQRHGLFALHSASLLYRGRAWLFSGRSGTGKSTHTALWNRLFGTPLLNGDLNLLGIRGEQPFVYGLPWCGTSGISTAAVHPLGGIVLLRQSRTNAVEPLSLDRRCLLTAQRMISPAWTEAQLHAILRFTQALAPGILICLLHCTREAASAAVIRDTIDTYLNQSREDE